MTQTSRHKLSDRETVAVGAVCMILSVVLCLALSIGLGRDASDTAQRVRRRMSLVGAEANASRTEDAGLSQLDVGATRPAQMNSLVADLRRAEMELRMKRGIAMIVSMAVGMFLFIALRALRAKPIGPVVIRIKERGAA